MRDPHAGFVTTLHEALVGGDQQALLFDREAPEAVVGQPFVGRAANVEHVAPRVLHSPHRRIGDVLVDEDLHAG